MTDTWPESGEVGSGGRVGKSERELQVEGERGWSGSGEGGKRKRVQVCAEGMGVFCGEDGAVQSVSEGRDFRCLLLGGKEIVLPKWDGELNGNQRRFLSVYSLGGSITKACEVAGLCVTTVSRWRRESEDFDDAMDMSKEIGIQRLEDWALERAMDMVNPSDRLVEFLLKAHRPERYRERVDHRISGGVEHRKRVVLEEVDMSRVVGGMAVESEILE